MQSTICVTHSFINSPFIYLLILFYVSFRYTTMWLDIYIIYEVIPLIRLVPSLVSYTVITLLAIPYAVLHIHVTLLELPICTS